MTERSDWPERIWFDPDKNGIGWTTEQREAMTTDVEYVHADRLAEAEAENRTLSGLVDKHQVALSDTCRDLAAAEARERKLREALRFYASFDGWDEYDPAGCDQTIINDGGDIARAALTDTASAGDSPEYQAHVRTMMSAIRGDEGQKYDAAPSAGDVRRRALEDIAEGRGMFGIDPAADLQWAMETAADALIATPATPTVEAGRDGFAKWFRKNYPGPDTIIYDPDWHAPKIFRAAKRFLSQQEGGENG